MLRIAIYGKGGIGKSTTVSNLSAALAQRGLTIMQIGCDPKADSTLLLMHGQRIDSVLDTMRAHGDPALDDVVHKGHAGVLCVEAGGPTPGTGCAGRGIITAFEQLDELNAYGVYRPDVVLYDVLGDVVCGGFSLPLRGEHSDILTPETLSAMGASPIAMAFGETFSAVQQGTVDGIMTPFVNFWKEGFYEVTKYVTQLQSSEFYHCLMVTSDFYNSLPDDLKAQFDETVAMTQEYSIDLGKQFENEIVPQNLKDLNIELVQLTPEQKAVFAEATAPVREELKDTVGTDFYNSVVDMLG